MTSKTTRRRSMRGQSKSLIYFNRELSAVFQQNRAAWVAAGYLAEMSSAIVCSPPPAQLIRLYHLTSADHAVNDIALGRIKVARFSDLNDPFELISVNFRESQVRKIIRDFKNAFDSETGLLSFSEDWKEPVLWSHYGARHRGICLGFNVPRTLVERVHYEDERLRAELDHVEAPSLSEELQRLLRCTKYRRWEYEREYRRFVPLKSAISEGRLHFFPFGAELELAEVILGPECVLPLQQVRHLVQAKYPNAVVFKARLAFKFFHIVPQESTIPIQIKIVEKKKVTKPKS